MAADAIRDGVASVSIDFVYGLMSEQKKAQDEEDRLSAAVATAKKQMSKLKDQVDGKCKSLDETIVQFEVSEKGFESVADSWEQKSADIKSLLAAEEEVNTKGCDLSTSFVEGAARMMERLSLTEAKTAKAASQLAALRASKAAMVELAEALPPLLEEIAAEDSKASSMRMELDTSIKAASKLKARTDELTNSIATLTDETTRHAALAVSAEKEWRATTAQLQKVEAQSESMRTEHASKTAAVKQHEKELKRATKEALEEADAAVAAASNDKAEAGALEADREEMLGEIDDMDSDLTSLALEKSQLKKELVDARASISSAQLKNSELRSTKECSDHESLTGECADAAEALKAIAADTAAVDEAARLLGQEDMAVAEEVLALRAQLIALMRDRSVAPDDTTVDTTLAAARLPHYVDPLSFIRLPSPGIAPPQQAAEAAVEGVDGSFAHLEMSAASSSTGPSYGDEDIDSTATSSSGGSSSGGGDEAAPAVAAGSPSSPSAPSSAAGAIDKEEPEVFVDLSIAGNGGAAAALPLWSVEAAAVIKSVLTGSGAGGDGKAQPTGSIDEGSHCGTTAGIPVMAASTWLEEGRRIMRNARTDVAASSSEAGAGAGSSSSSAAVPTVSSLTAAVDELSIILNGSSSSEVAPSPPIFAGLDLSFELNTCVVVPAASAATTTGGLVASFAALKPLLVGVPEVTAVDESTGATMTISAPKPSKFTTVVTKAGNALATRARLTGEISFITNAVTDLSKETENLTAASRAALDAAAVDTDGKEKAKAAASKRDADSHSKCCDELDAKERDMEELKTAKVTSQTAIEADIKAKTAVAERMEKEVTSLRTTYTAVTSGSTDGIHIIADHSQAEADDEHVADDDDNDNGLDAIDENDLDESASALARHAAGSDDEDAESAAASSPPLAPTSSRQPPKSKAAGGMTLAGLATVSHAPSTAVKGFTGPTPATLPVHATATSSSGSGNASGKAGKLTSSTSAGAPMTIMRSSSFRALKQMNEGGDGDEAMVDQTPAAAPPSAGFTAADSEGKASIKPILMKPVDGDDDEADDNGNEEAGEHTAAAVATAVKPMPNRRAFTGAAGAASASSAAGNGGRVSRKRGVEATASSSEEQVPTRVSRPKPSAAAPAPAAAATSKRNGTVDRLLAMSGATSAASSASAAADADEDDAVSIASSQPSVAIGAAGKHAQRKAKQEQKKKAQAAAATASKQPADEDNGMFEEDPVLTQLAPKPYGAAASAPFKAPMGVGGGHAGASSAASTGGGRRGPSRAGKR